MIKIFSHALVRHQYFRRALWQSGLLLVIRPRATTSVHHKFLLPLFPKNGMVCITKSSEDKVDRSICEELQGVKCNWYWNILENWHLYNNKPDTACSIPAFCFSVAKSKFRVFLFSIWRTVFSFIVKCKTLENINCVIAGNFCYIATQFMPLSILYFIVFHVYVMPLHFSTETAEQSCVNSLQEKGFKSNTQSDLLLYGHWDRFFIILSTSASVLWISNPKLPPVQAESNMDNNVLRVQQFLPY